jgi:hypothetical protein
VSLVRALRTDDVVAKAIADAHTTAIAEAMEYLAAHAGYTRVHNPRTGEKDPVRLPGLGVMFEYAAGISGHPGEQWDRRPLPLEQLGGLQHTFAQAGRWSRMSQSACRD